MYKEKDPFRNRYRITGSLTCRTPLHVGDGERDELFAVRAKKLVKEVGEESEEARYATTATDGDGKPVVPGSTLKGILRHWLRERGIRDADLEPVFGKMQSGGKAVFRDARWKPGGPEIEPGFRWFDPKRGTCLEPHVVLDARTRSAKAGLLYYTEFVPEGASFRVEIVGQNWSEDDLLLLLFALGCAFTDGERPVHIGAEQAGHWGEMEWRLDDVEVIGIAERDRWLAGPVTSYEKAFRSVLPQQPDLVKKAMERWQRSAVAGVVDLDVELRFEGAFLINDPSQERKRKEHEEIDGVSHVTIRKSNGAFYLPQSSVRGALRAQARKIWQTMAWDRAANLNLMERDREKTEARDAKKVSGMAPFFRFVGATGWRSPLEIPDFKLVGTPVEHGQEFVAIDRFTGGAADQRKFNAQGLYSPVFQGKIRVRTDRWEAAGVGAWGWIWLAFLLRDLVEGDIGFGFGVAKGYGSCTATVKVSGTGEDAKLLQGVLQANPATLAAERVQQWGQEWMAVTQPEEAA